MNLSAFKAYDIRGKYPDVVNEELAYAVGRAFVQHLSAKTVVVGMDMRESSGPLKEKLIEGISCEGADVIDIGMCTTPMLNFAVQEYGYDGGVMITASHSPESDGGIKLIDSKGIQIGEGFGMEDIKNIASSQFTECPGKGAITEKEVLGDYLAHLMRMVPSVSGPKIVIDYGNGMGSISAKPFFARMDLDVIEMYEQPDGDFPNHPANPQKRENLAALQKEVVKQGADLGVAFDGDADRVAFIDENGNVAPMDLLFVYLAEDALTRSDDKKVYYDIRSSKSVPEFIKKVGGEPILMRAGNPFYKKALKEDGGAIGAEQTGHIMYSENNGADDALYAAIKMIEVLIDKKKKPSELIDAVSKYETSAEISESAKNPETVYERAKSEFSDAKLITIDGVYFDYGDGFVLIRRSQTEPHLFRVRAEAKEKKTMESRLSKVLEVIRS